jgi:hypothetical protein
MTQERLSEGDLANHIGWLAVGLDSKGMERLQSIVNEVVRLKAIEAERDRYKTAYEYASTNLVGYGLKIAAANAEKVSKGEQPNE